MSLKLASFKHRRVLHIGVGVLGLALLLPTFINNVTQPKQARAEMPGGTCIVATQDSYDKLIANYGDTYSDVSDPNKTQVIITVPATAQDTDIVCMPDVGLKQLVVSDATAATDITIANVKTLPTQLASSGSQAGLTSLIGLEYAQHLTGLDLSYLGFSDIMSLSGLTNLNKLFLSYNQINNLTPLAGLANLRELKLSHNQITDLTPLSSLFNLRNIDLSTNQITDVTPLASLASLLHLEITYNQIEDFSSLSGLTGIVGRYSTDEPKFMGGGQKLVKMAHGQTVWPNKLFDNRGSLYESNDLFNITRDDVNQTLIITQSATTAYVEYCPAMPSEYSSDVPAEGWGGSGGSIEWPCNLLIFNPGEGGLTLVGKTVDGTSSIITSQDKEFVYETVVFVPKEHHLSGVLSVEYADDAIQQENNLAVVRIVEDIDPRIIPIESGLYVGDIPFNSTNFAQYYRAITSINGQSVESIIVPRYMLSSNDSDWMSYADWAALMAQNGDFRLNINGLEKTLELSLRTVAVLANNVVTEQLNIPSASRFFLGLVKYADLFSGELISLDKTTFYQFGDGQVFVSFLSGVGVPKSGISSANYGAAVLGIAILGLGAAALTMARQRKVHFKK